MSGGEFVSDADYSEESYNWSKLRKKYLDQDEGSNQELELAESKPEKKYKRYRKGLTFEEIANLHLKKKNLEEFISSIGSISVLPLRK